MAGKTKLTPREPNRFMDLEIHASGAFTLSVVNYLGERAFFHVGAIAAEELVDALYTAKAAKVPQAPGA